MALLSGEAAAAPKLERQLIATAKAEARLQGIQLEDKRPPTIIDDGEQWVVVLDPPPRGWKGGGVEVTIEKKSGKAIDLVRSK